ncbi:MAG: toprim domain-containing protein [Oscillospiraceae bacterium]
MFYSDEQIRRAEERGITEYFRSRGYSCDREGKEIHIHGFGGMKVKEDTNEYYIHSRSAGGVGLVNCLMKAFEMSFPEAVGEALDGEIPGSEYIAEKRTENLSDRKTSEETSKPAVIPEAAADNKRVYAYLSKERCIYSQIINELINSGLLYQDTKGNAVFLHRRDNIPCGAEIHGTGRKKYTIGNTSYTDISDKRITSIEPCEAEMLGRFLENTDISFSGYVYSNEANIVSDSKNHRVVNDMAELISGIDSSALNSDVQKKLKSYKGVAPGTTNSFFEYTKGKPQKAYVFESTIDLMSFMQLHPEVNDCSFVSMAGLKKSAIEELLSRNMKVILCVDNDRAGKEFCERFKGRCFVFTECRLYGIKDFNELLQKQFRKRDFFSAVDKLSEWSEKVIAKEQTKEVRYGTHGNRTI